MALYFSLNFQVYLLFTSKLSLKWTLFLKKTDSYYNEFTLPNMSLLSQASSLFSMLSMFTASFVVGIFDKERPSFGKQCVSLLEWGHLVLVSSYGRIVGSLLLIAYPGITRQIFLGSAALWLGLNLIIAYRYVTFLYFETNCCFIY